MNSSPLNYYTLSQKVAKHGRFSLFYGNNFPEKISICFFDSGIGGLSILNHFIRQNPWIHLQKNFEIHYCADNEYFPYGDLPSDLVIERTMFWIKEMEKFNPKIFVIACNTATVTSIKFLREKFPQYLFVGIEPYIKFPYLDQYEKIMALVTPQTYKSQRVKELKQLHDPLDKIIITPMPELAKIITEHFTSKSPDINNFYNLLQDQFLPIVNSKPQLLILGCTHYILIEDIFHNFFSIPIITPNQAITNRIFSLINSLKAFTC